MRLAYPSGTYRKDSATGGNIHIGQFISNVVAMGHEVWTWPGSNHPAANRMLSTRLERLKTLRRMDVIYVRVEWAPPKECSWGVAPYRQIIGSPVTVWEFNTVPEQGMILGRSEVEINNAIEEFRHYGRGCDLAICVSNTLADYVHNKLGIKRVLTVPNGSDPNLFRPDIQPVKRIIPNQHELNAVWIGSANLTWSDFDLLQATALLLWQSSEKDKIRFHLIGQAFNGLMRDMPPNVNYWGPEDYPELPQWLAAMDVGLCMYHPGPSDFGSPLKLFDYMACGRAIVASDIEVVEEITGDCNCALLVQPDNPKKLAEGIIQLIEYPEKRRIMGANGRSFADERFDRLKITKYLINVFKDVKLGVLHENRQIS